MGRLRTTLTLLAATTVAFAAACGGGSSSSKGSATGAKLTMYAFSSSPAEDAVLRQEVDAYNKQGKNTAEVKIQIGRASCRERV